MKPVRILEFVSNLSLGGTERAMQEFAIGLHQRKDFRVVVGAYDISGPRRAVLEKHGIRVVKLTNETLAGFVRRERIAVVHVHTIHIRKFIPQEIPIIQEVVFSGGYEPEAAMNLPISMALAKKITSALPVTYGKDFIPLYYPQNIEAWDKHRLTKLQRREARAAHGFDDSHLVIGRLGRAEPSKTDFLLLASAPRIAHAVPEARFLFVGLPRLYRVWLRCHPILRNRCVFLPVTADDATLARHYQSMDVFWHTAERGETFGNVLAEAGIFELPVITHSTPFRGGDLNEARDNAQVEIVEHGKTGFVASYPSAVVRAVQQLRKASVRARLGRAGRQRVRTTFASDVIIEQFASIVSSVLQGSKPRVHLSKQIVQAFFTNGYAQALAQGIDSVSSTERFKYALQKRLYEPIEYCYLVMRFALRKIGVDLERS